MGCHHAIAFIFSDIATLVPPSPSNLLHVVRWKTNLPFPPGTTDLTRFKEVLLRLKREGSTAPGAGGY